MSIQIEEKNTFDKALKTGISMFLGSGFSVSLKIKQEIICLVELNC